MGNKSSRVSKDGRIIQEENTGIYYIPNNNSSAARRDPAASRRLNNDSSLVSRGGPAISRRDPNMDISLSRVPVSRKIPKYAFGNYADPNFFRKREEFKNNPNYIAYKKKIKDYVKGKNNRTLKREFSDGTIKNFLEKNYDNVENENVNKAFNAMRTYKRSLLRSKNEDNRKQAWSLYEKQFRNLKDLEHNMWKPAKYFAESQKDKQKENKRKTRLQFPKKFLMATTEEELNAIDSTKKDSKELQELIWWVEFIKYQKPKVETEIDIYSRSWNNNDDPASHQGDINSTILDIKNKTIKKIKKIFPDISKEEIVESLKYIYPWNRDNKGKDRDRKFDELKSFVSKIKNRRSLKNFKIKEKNLW
jgi:hypothetical protein